MSVSPPVIQEAGSAPLPLSEYVVGLIGQDASWGARSRDGLDHGDDVCGVGDAGVTAGCPHVRPSAMTLARIRYPSLKLRVGKHRHDAMRRFV